MCGTSILTKYMPRFFSPLLLRFDTITAIRAARITLASLAAFVVSLLLGLDSPYLAAMTIWAVAQPTRGALIGKGIARIAGALLGAMAAVVLVGLLGLHPAAYAFGLAAWISACSVRASLSSGLHPHAAVLAAYTALLLSLIGLAPEANPWLTGLSRLATILVAIAVSASLTRLWAPVSDHALLRRRTSRTAEEACQWIDAVLSESRSRKEVMALETRLVSDMAIIDSQCDTNTAEGISSRHERRHIRRLLTAILSAMAATRSLIESPHAPLPEAERTDSRHTTPQDVHRTLDAWLTAQEPIPAHLRESASVLRGALFALEMEQKGLEPLSIPSVNTSNPLVTFRDWPDALRNGARTFIVMLALGLAWVVTQWPLFLLSLIGAAILCTVFATQEVPRTELKRSPAGALIGALASLLFVAGPLPWLHTLPALLLALAPFLFTGAWLLTRRRSKIVGLDYCATFLLLTAPSLSTPIDLEQTLALLPGPVLAACVTLLAFRYIFPSNPTQRLLDLAEAMIQEIRRLGQDQLEVSASYWRAAALHRGLRLVMRASTAGVPPRQSVDMAILSINLGAELFRIRQALPLLPEEDPLALQTQQLLQALSQLEHCPQRLSDAFIALSEQAPQPSGLQMSLRRAGEMLERLPTQARVILQA